MNFGARVLFFRANKEEKVICHVYLEEPFVPDTNGNMLAGKQEPECERFMMNLVRLP